MRPVVVTVQAHAAATPTVAFDAVVPIDLPSAFKGYGPLPAVRAVRDQPATWDTDGQTRTIDLADGGVMHERLLQVVRPAVCAYEVVPVKGPLKLVVERINGRFTFEDVFTSNLSKPGGPAVRISWSYAFTPRRGRTALVLALAPVWRRYARRVITACVIATEQAAAAAAREA